MARGFHRVAVRCFVVFIIVCLSKLIMAWKKVKRPCIEDGGILIVILFTVV